jgi:hypothetical protein
MLENALTHYSNRLVKLEENNEVLHDHLQNDYIKKDLLHESRKAQNLKKSLNAAEGEFFIPALDEDNRKIACDALKCYLNDLKESVSLIKDKLGGAEPAFEQVNKEISEAQKYFEIICNQGK